MIIISGSSNIPLAKKIANNLQCEYVAVNTNYFPDSELNITLEEQILDQDIIIVQSLSRPVNDNFVELLFIIDLLKKLSVKSIRLIIPYLAYARQNHNLSFPIEVIIRTIESSGIREIVTLDLHTKELEKLFKVKVTNISSADIFTPYVQEDYANLVVVSPDKGGRERAIELANKLNCNFAVINKVRANNLMEMDLIEGKVKGEHCIIIDDIVDSAITLCNATEFLIKNSVLSIKAFITHPVLTGAAIEKIENLPLKDVFITDSIKTSSLPEKFKLLSSSMQFCKHIQT
jgi:ribose-phosphate pyrophosphokinase